MLEVVEAEFLISINLGSQTLFKTEPRCLFSNSHFFAAVS